MSEYQKPNYYKKLRVDAGLTMQQLADLAGTTAPQINKLEKGFRKLDRKWALRIAPHLGVTPEDLVFPENAKFRQKSETHKILQEAPVYGVTGEDEKSYAISDENEINRRPVNSPAMGRNGFYVTVVGKAMRPLFEEGQILSVNPDIPLVKGKPCLIETINNEVLVRRFISRNSTTVTIEQLNPQKKMTMPITDIVRVSAIVGQEF